MQKNNVYATETHKSLDHFIKDLKNIANDCGFMIHNEDKMDMARTFGLHGLELDDSFDLHMIQLCKPEKAAKSLSANPERAILMPKFIMTFSQNNKTQIRFLRFSPENIMAVVDDAPFPASLTETYDRIIQMIEEAKR
jgi:uncharacterized protein (DUF302 family)